MASDFERLGRDICEVHWYRGDEPPADEDIRALIVLGGTMSADGDTQYPWLTREKDLIAGVVKRGGSVLGIGLGAQLIARSLGAEVRPGYHGEMGWSFLRPTADALGSPYTEIFDWSRLVFHWHKDEFDIPPGATRLAFSDACMNQAFCIGTRVIGVQPHIEKTPMSAHKLIQHCRDDVVGNPSIRYPGQLYGTPRQFYEMNEMLSRLLAIWLPEADKD